MNNYFAATLDTVSKIITALVAPIFTIFPVLLFFVLRSQQDQNYIAYYIGIILLLWIAFAVCLAYWVQGYSLTETELIIHQKFTTTKLPLSTIVSATAVSKQEMGLVIRYMGNGGLFGYTGYFSNKLYGRMQWYVTSMQHLIVLELIDKKYICISPNEVQDFLKKIKSIK
jgi:Bacterial PH domain